VKRYLPVLEWLPRYDRGWLRGDLLAGATVWAVLIPSALAYAGIVGVDAVVGLYTVPLALAAYAVFGGSRLLVVGPDAAISVMAAATVASVVTDDPQLDLVVALALISGGVYLAFAVLRMGWIADLIPDPVIKGFIEGLVWVTILGQVPKLLGVRIEGEGFFDEVIEAVGALSDAHAETAIVGVGCLASLLLLRRFAPRLPGPLIVLVAAIVVVGGLGLADEGVAVVGETSGALDGIRLPTGLGVDTLLALVPGAIAISVLGFTESLGAAKRAAESTGERINPDQELLALGMANLGAGVSGGYVVTGALSKTAVAIDADGKTQVANLFAGALGLLTLLFLLPLFENLADAALAAIVIVAMSGLSDLGYFRSLWSIRRLEFLVAIAAFVGVLVVGVLAGVIVGVLLALVILADHIGKPPTAVLGRTADGSFVDQSVDTTAENIPGMLIWRQDAPLVFLNARRLSDALRELTEERGDLQVVVIDCSAMSDIDTTATTAFAAVGRDLRGQGIAVWVTAIRQRNWERVVAALGGPAITPPPRFVSNEAAVAEFARRQGDRTE